MHKSTSELIEGLAEVLDSPKEVGKVSRICSRSDYDQRHCPDSCDFDVDGGTENDNWKARCQDANKPVNFDAQITAINTRFAQLVAEPLHPIELAGDNLFLDYDLSEDNLKIGQQLKIGEAEFIVTPKPHTGCSKFQERFGQDALRFMNARENKALRLRGIYFRVIKSGKVAVGDRVVKL